MAESALKDRENDQLQSVPTFLYVVNYFAIVPPKLVVQLAMFPRRMWGEGARLYFSVNLFNAPRCDTMVKISNLHGCTTTLVFREPLSFSFRPLQKSILYFFSKL